MEHKKSKHKTKGNINIPRHIEDDNYRYKMHDLEFESTLHKMTLKNI